MKHIELPEVGRIVEITRGRDRGLYAVVVGLVPDRYVLLADGHVRKVAQPKKKNVAHVRLTPHRIDSGKVPGTSGVQKFTNAQLRYALREFREAPQNELDKEGDGAHGEG